MGGSGAESEDCCVCPSSGMAVLRMWQNRGCQVLLCMNPLSLLKLFGCNCIPTASFTTLSIQPFTQASVNTAQFHAVPCVYKILCYSWSFWLAQVKGPHLFYASGLHVFLIYTLLHSYSIQNMLGVLRPRLSLCGQSADGFLHWNV